MEREKMRERVIERYKDKYIRSYIYGGIERDTQKECKRDELNKGDRDTEIQIKRRERW